MIMNYKQVKADVLAMYDSFLSQVEKAKDGKQTTYDAVLRKLQKDAENIRNDILLLLVVGEANSGKSTFINAYLGKEILPMDAKQCTSCIVEIRYGRKYTLRAVYADGQTKRLEEERQIRDFLKKNAAIDENYRDIPVSTINQFLIIPSKGKKIPNAEIRELMKMIEKDNIYKLDPQVYEQKVRQYIANKAPLWKKIVKRIEIAYPFKDEELRGIQIVDSPGVNAEGRVGEITREYIINASAVMFLKPIVGSTLEAVSFKKFLESASVARNPDAMFLVLTRAANETPDIVERIREDAYRQFPNINRKQILHLDSKVELFRNKFKEMGEEELRSYIDRQIAEEKFDAFLEAPWYRARFNRESYLEKLASLSNFDEMDRALNQFARRAQYILLSQLLGGMILVLNKIRAEQEEDVKHYRQKAKNPIELASKLESAEEGLRELQKKINVTLKDITGKYQDENGVIRRRADKELKSYKMEIARIWPGSSRSIDELEKATFGRIQMLAKFEEEMQKNIVAECDEALVAFSQKDELNYTALKPDLTPEMIDKIKAEHRSEAEHAYQSGLCFKETRRKLDQSLYFNLVKTDILKRVDAIWKDQVKALLNYVAEVTDAYRGELNQNASLQKERYKQILEDKATAEEMQAKIVEMEKTIKAAQLLAAQLKGMKGGIDRNVWDKVQH